MNKQATGSRYMKKLCLAYMRIWIKAYKVL